MKSTAYPLDGGVCCGPLQEILGHWWHWRCSDLATEESQPAPLPTDSAKVQLIVAEADLHCHRVRLQEDFAELLVGQNTRLAVFGVNQPFFVLAHEIRVQRLLLLGHSLVVTLFRLVFPETKPLPATIDRLLQASIEKWLKSTPRHACDTGERRLYPDALNSHTRDSMYTDPY